MPSLPRGSFVAAVARVIVVLVAAFALVLPTAVPAQLLDPTPPTVYVNGDIITMEGDAPRYVEVLVVASGKIVYAGTRAEAVKHTAPRATTVDLHGRTLLPGFIDAHGHVWNAGFQKLAANLLPPPDGGGKDIASLVALLKAWQDRNAAAIGKAGAIIGFGYDDSQLAEKRHPTADDLDAVSTELPVLVIHQSGHLAAMNHKALAAAGYDAYSKDPSGGVIRREADGRTPNGVLEEMAFFVPAFRMTAVFDRDANDRIALAGIETYMQFGFTTAQEGRASAANVETWRRLAAARKLAIDVAAYVDIQSAADTLNQYSPTRQYANHFRIAGAKLSLDGSPQGRTAWMTEPYFHPPAGQSADYRGYPAVPAAEDREALVNLAFERRWQLLTHANGDAASDALIDAIAKAAARYGNVDRRAVMIHAQAVREDQLDRMKALKIVPSFFGMQTYYWGDWHRDETLGPARAERWDPAVSAMKRGMLFTQHHDAPVALPSAVMILHTVVNRTTRSGAVLGPDQRLSPYVALKSITDWAAWQYFEEKTKGTLTAGKLADLVILDRNPLKIAPETIRNTQVVETIKAGKTVYRR